MAKNKLEKFEIQEITRDLILKAEYNPRKISEQAEKKLRKFIREDGMLAPIIINKRTGNVVSGHQRLSAMDAILKTPDYPLTVSIIDVSENDEVRYNVFMNNPSAQGEWDKDILKELGDLFPEVTPESMGFDKIDIELIFEGETNLFASEEAQTEAKKEYSTDYYREQKKEMRDKFKEQNQNGESVHLDENDYSITFIFENNRDKRDFMQKVGKDQKEKYLRAGLLFDLSDGKFNLRTV